MNILLSKYSQIAAQFSVMWTFGVAIFIVSRTGAGMCFKMSSFFCQITDYYRATYIYSVGSWHKSENNATTVLTKWLLFRHVCTKYGSVSTLDDFWGESTQRIKEEIVSVRLPCSSEIVFVCMAYLFGYLMCNIKMHI